MSEMEKKIPLLAVNYYFSSDELGNRVFDASNTGSTSVGMRAFRAFIRERGGDVVTLDTVDFKDPSVRAVLYFEYNWRLVKRDPFLTRIPFEKRALVLLEPANVNPTMYYTSVLRNRFHTVFTWDLNLLRRNPGYVRVNVPVGAEPCAYRENRFANIGFADKRFLVAVSMNRWSYMPQSTYGLRRRAYRHFERTFPGDFDLYGKGWNSPCVGFERWTGHPQFASWRGEIEGGWDDKVRKIAKYKFALCFENNASEPGYISEKITDCFCARCVPIYYGSKETDALIPKDAWIDLRDFRDFRDLGAYLRGMDKRRYGQYIEAIDRFMGDDGLFYFSTEHFYGVIADRLGFNALETAPRADGRKDG